MLPDFPKQKERLAEFYLHVIRTAAAESNFAADCPHMPLSEGLDGRLHREDGTQDDIDFKRLEAGIQLHHDEFPDLTPRGLAEKYRELGRDMGNKQLKMLLEEVNQTCDAFGQTVDGRGKPFSTELWLQMLETIDIPFSEDGQMGESFCLIHPSMAEKVKTELERLETEPDLKKRYEEIKAKKRMKWRDREAARKLVG